MSPDLHGLIRMVLRNALANVFRGGAGLAVALLLPIWLTRSLAPDRYAVYVFLLQAAAYIAYFDFGLHTALARFAARMQEKGQARERDEYLNSGLVALAIVGFGVGLAGSILAQLLPYLYPALKPAALREMSAGLTLLSWLSGLALPGAVFTGVLVGLQRSELATLSIGGTKIAAAAVLALASPYRPHMAWVAATLGVSALVSAALQGWSARRLLRDWRIRFRPTPGPALRELAASCGTLSLWSFGTLLVNGTGLFLLSYLDFPAIAYYSLAANLVMVIAGLSNAAFSAFMPAAAVLQARAQQDLLGDLVIRATAAGYWLVLLGALPLLLLGKWILNVWVGPEYARQTLPILHLLVAGSGVRMLGNAYSVALIGTGQQHKALLSPLVEVGVHFAVSLAAGLVWGATGVALGTLAGGIAGVALHAIYNIPRTQEIRMHSFEFLRRGLVRPGLNSLPLLAGCYCFHRYESAAWGPLALGALLSALLILRSGTFRFPSGQPRRYQEAA